MQDNNLAGWRDYTVGALRLQVRWGFGGGIFHAETDVTPDTNKI